MLPAALQEGARLLLANADYVKAAPTFDELIDLVERIAGPVSTFGELAIYDTARRIGTHLGLEPEKVYLHRGTRTGANALGRAWLGRDGKRQAGPWRGQPSLEMSELPAELTELTPGEVEDALCIYKSVLQKMARGEGIEFDHIAGCGAGARRGRGSRPC